MVICVLCWLLDLLPCCRYGGGWWVVVMMGASWCGNRDSGIYEGDHTREHIGCSIGWEDFGSHVLEFN